mgnify:CR=1 FL=1
MAKSKRVFIMAIIVVTVAIIIGAIVYFTGDTKEVLEGTLVYEGYKL